MRITTLFAAVFLMADTAIAGDAEDVFGLWLIEGDAAIIDISPCGASACGKIAWLAEPTREDGSIKLDRTNPDPALQSIPICGMDMLGGFRREDNKWVDGFIYNPDDGNTYSSTMHVTDDGNLYVRGYVGISLLGKSLVGRRQDHARDGC